MADELVKDAIEERSMMFRGLKTSWLQAGNQSRPILMFLHGYPDTAWSWDLQLKYFRDDYQVIAPFSRGAQPSSKGTAVRNYGEAGQALDHLMLLREVDPTDSRPIILVGHDLGVVQLWYLAMLLGKRLQACIVINGMSTKQMGRRLANWRQLKKSWYIFAMQIPVLPEQILRRFAGPLLQRAYKSGKLPPGDRPKVGKTVGAVVNPVNQYRAYLRSLFERTLESQPKLKAPLMVLWGKDDPFLEIPKESEFEELAESFEIRVLPGNHWLHREAAEDVNELITDFLARLGE